MLISVKLVDAVLNEETPKEFFRRHGMKGRTNTYPGYVVVPMSNLISVDTMCTVKTADGHLVAHVSYCPEAVDRKWQYSRHNGRGGLALYGLRHTKDEAVRAAIQDYARLRASGTHLRENETPREFFRRHNISSGNVYRILPADPGWLKIQVPSVLRSGERVYWNMIRVGISQTDTIQKLSERLEHLVKTRKGYKIGDVFRSQHYGSFRVEEGGIVKRIGT